MVLLNFRKPNPNSPIYKLERFLFFLFFYLFIFFWTSQGRSLLYSALLFFTDTLYSYIWKVALFRVFGKSVFDVLNSMFHGCLQYSLHLTLQTKRIVVLLHVHSRFRTNISKPILQVVFISIFLRRRASSTCPLFLSLLFSSIVRDALIVSCSMALGS